MRNECKVIHEKGDERSLVSPSFQGRLKKKTNKSQHETKKHTNKLLGMAVYPGEKAPASVRSSRGYRFIPESNIFVTKSWTNTPSDALLDE